MKHKTTGLLALAAILVVSGCNSSSNKPKKDTTVKRPQSFMKVTMRLYCPLRQAVHASNMPIRPI